METKIPLLSIVIATKNRVQYCINCIETILEYAETDFELIVQDNTDNFDLKKYVQEKISDSRLVYNYTPPPFSSIDNFNAALELANGEFVCLIGDDDGICDTIFDVVRWAKVNDVDSVCPKVFVDYYWPGAFSNNSKGYVNVPYFTRKVWKKDPRKDIQNMVNDGILNYMGFNLPKFYHGIVKKSCFDEIKNNNGYYIGGLSPDIYSAVSLSTIVKNHVVIDFPITISGACKVSTTVAGFTGGHSGELKDAPHFRDRGDYVWDSQVPKFYSVQTIWAESALKAIKENRIKVNLLKLNIYRILSKSIISTPSHLGLFVNESIKVSNDFRFLFYLRLLYNLLFIFVQVYTKKIVNRLFNMFRTKVVRYENVDNLRDATQVINDFLKTHALHINIVE